MSKIKTSQKILDCATSMFAQHGYEGTIMDELAERCGVNKASIYYHHKDKANLYDNALTALFTPIADAVIAAVDAEESPADKLLAHITSFAKANGENPNFSSILMREMASGGVNMPERARQQMQRILTLLAQTLKQGENQNIFRPADPLIIHFMIVGTVNLFVSSVPFRKKLPVDDQCQHIKNTDIDSAASQLGQTIISSLLISNTPNQESIS